MKYLKKFKQIMEQEMIGSDEKGLPDVNYEKDFGNSYDKLGDSEQEEAETFATKWVPSLNPEGDYDITWNSGSEEITASFKDTGGPLEELGEGKGRSTFETIPGTSSNGKEYLGDVSYTESKKNPGDFQIVSIKIYNQ